MEQYNLPDQLRGKWIWVEAEQDQPDTYGFFRKEFTLDELPSSADLWISARSFFHVFVNGEHLSYSLDLCPVRGSYAWIFDISFMLNTGRNNISILGHNTTLCRTSCLTQPNGLWCQLNIDSKPFLWTDNSWQVHPAECYGRNRPRRSLASACTEKVDLSKVPANWRGLETEATSSGWTGPTQSVALQTEDWELVPFPAPPMTVNHARFASLVNRGSCHRQQAYTNVSFETMRRTKGDGIYGAESYLYSRDAVDNTSMQLYADNPCRLFVNGVLLYEQGIKPLLPGESYQINRKNCLRQHDGKTAVIPITISLKEGWNRITFFETVVPGTFGMAMILPDFGARNLKLLRHPEQDAMPGWCIAGPLRTPLPNILGHLVLNQFDNLGFYIPVDERPVDESAFLNSYRFVPEKGSSRRLDAGQKLEIQENEYAVLALPQCGYGCPDLEVQGNAGDILDIVSSTELAEGFVPPCHEGEKNVDTLILDDRKSEWMACLPRGIRYLMVVARKAAGTITITNPVAAIREYNFENFGAFESSDPALNQIWRTSQRTLAATVQEIFIDSPTRDEAQYVGDAMIQSWATYHVYGDFGLAQKSLLEFAYCQFETGEMPAACPSSFYINIPDYALLWPVWLQQHYMYTGSRQLLEKLSPHLIRLFAYFDSVAQTDSAILEDMQSFGGYCFLDHADIDRRGVSTGLNALYSRALLSSAAVMEELGSSDEAQKLRDRASKVCRTLRQLCWDEQKGLFADSYHEGTRSKSCSLQTNILSIYGGVARSRDYKAIFEQLFTAKPPYYKNMPPNTNSPYFNYFILETAFALGRRQWACDYMRWYWNSMLEAGADSWWELFDPRKKTGEMFIGSKCHGYGVSPTGFLIREIAGIRPAKPGFTSIYFNPLTEGVNSVKATVPTPYGHIMVEWKLTKDRQLEAVIDANYPLSIIPELEPEIADSALIRVSDEVTVFASAY